jgi:hypothetical protein
LVTRSHRGHPRLGTAFACTSLFQSHTGRCSGSSSRSAGIRRDGRCKPNPNLRIEPGVPSPYLFNLDLAVPIETAGKRGQRIESAQSLERAARFDLADSFWEVRSRVRTALLNYLLAARSLDFLRSEEQVRRDQINILEQSLSVGEIPRPELNLARIELSKTHSRISSAFGKNRNVESPFKPDPAISLILLAASHPLAQVPSVLEPSGRSAKYMGGFSCLSIQSILL